MDIIGHVAAALGPEIVLTNLTLNIQNNLKLKIIYKIDRRGGGPKIVY